MGITLVMSKLKIARIIARDPGPKRFRTSPVAPCETFFTTTPFRPETYRTFRPSWLPGVQTT